MLKFTIWNIHFEIYAQKVFTASAMRTSSSVIEEDIMFTNARAEFVRVIDYIGHVNKVISFPEISSNVHGT